MVIIKAVHFCTQLLRTRWGTKENLPLGNLSSLSNIEHYSRCGKLHYVPVKTKELSRKQILFVPCPTCGAALEEGCVLHTGALRTEPHRDRKLSAADAVETKGGKRLK
jgi:hypothetical protein